MSYQNPGGELIAQALGRENQRVQEAETRRLLDERYPDRGVRHRLTKLLKRGHGDAEIPGVSATGGAPGATTDKYPPLPGL